MVVAGNFILRPYVDTEAQPIGAAVRESTETIGRWMGWAKADFSQDNALCWFAHCNAARAAGSAHVFSFTSHT